MAHGDDGGDGPVEELPFETPSVFLNDHGWGPTPENEPAQFRFLPYCPFNKSDRLGKAAELTQSAYYLRMREQRRARFEDAYKVSNESLKYEYDVAEDKSFRMVDSEKGKKKSKSRFGPNFKQGGFGARGRGGARGGARDVKALAVQNAPGDRRRLQGGPGAGGRGGRFGWRGRGGAYRGRMENRKASVNVESDWQTLEEVDLPQLSKLHVASVPEAEDLEWFGVLDQYNEAYDKVKRDGKTEGGREGEILCSVAVSTCCNL